MLLVCVVGVYVEIKVISRNHVKKSGERCLVALRPT